MKKLLIISLCFFSLTAHAAPEYIFQRGIMPETDNKYFLGSTSPALRWKGIILGTATSTAANGFNITAGCFAINNVCIGGSTGGGSGGVGGGLVEFGIDGGITGATSPLYLSAWDNTVDTTVESKNYILSPSTALLKNLYIRADSNNLDVSTVFTVRINDVPSTLTVTIAAGVTTGSNTANSVSILAGDRISVHATAAGGGGGLSIDNVIASIFFESTSGNSSKWATTTNNVGLYPNGGITMGIIIGGTATTSDTKLEVVGTTTAKQFVANGTATSTGANGWNITSGCFAINNVCLGGSGTVTGSGTQGQLSFWTSTTALGSVATGTVSESGLIGVTAGQSIIGSGLTISLDNIAANTVIGNPTGASAAPQAVATSTLFGGGVTGGWVLMSNGTTWQPSATATCVQITGSAGLCDGNDASSAGGGVGTVSTSTTPVVGGLSYWTTAGQWPETLSSVATTSVTCSGNTSCTGFTVIGGSPITISSTGGGSGLSTTTPISSSNVLVYSSVGAGAAYGAATTTLAGTGIVNVSNSPVVLGASGAVVSLTGGTNGEILGWLGGIPTWTATTTFSGGLAYTAGNVTNTLTAGDGLTRTVDDIDCDTASASVFGCLTSANWTTFNNKQDTISVTWPITLSGATVGFNGLSTSTAAVVGNIPYFSGVNTFANIATGTVSSSGGITTTASRYVLNGALAISCDVASGSIPGCLSSTDWTTFNDSVDSTRTLTVAGTANQITSSAGAQDLSANRTWTLSLPNHVIFPSSYVAALGTTTNATSTNLTVTGNLIHEALTSALILTGSNGAFAEYQAQACTNQFVRGLSALGAPTCATVVAGDIDLADLTATDTTLTFSGTYDGSTARTIGLNLGQANTWTALQQFSANASTTGLSAGYGYFGTTATSSFNNVGDLLVVGSTSLRNFTGLLGTSSHSTSTSFFSTIASSTKSFISELLRIPFGTAPAATNPGEIAHDTTSDMLILDDNVVAMAKKTIWSVTVASTSPAFISEGLLPVPSRFYGYTMTDIACKVDSGTSKVIAVEDASANSTEDITCATTVTEDDGTITNATFTSLEEAYIDFGVSSGVPDYVTITVYGTVTRD